MMIVYYCFAGIIMAIQLLVLVEAVRNYKFVKRKYRPVHSSYTPKVAIISPCKGIDTTFDRNISSFFHLDYPDYEIFFVVDSESDPAHDRLKQLIEENAQKGDIPKTHLIISGKATSSSQKVYNLLAVCDNLPDEFKVLVFVDSDACSKAHFLRSLVYPLRKITVGATTGYRWFVPTDKRLSTACLSGMNAFFASVLGPHQWNSTWGGAMAIRREVYDQVDMSTVWRHASTDDLSMTNAVKKANYEVVFVPACFVASYEEMGWKTLFTFGRRQFIITKVYKPDLWWLAFLGITHYLVAFWLGLAVTLGLYLNDSPHWKWAAILPGTLMLFSIVKALLRQVLIRKILPEDKKKLLFPAFLDLFFQPILSIFSLICIISAGFSRSIGWRGIKYILHAPDRTEVIYTDE